MYHLLAHQNLLKTLTDKLSDRDLVDGIDSKISAIGDRYSLTLGEVGEMYILIDKIIRGEISRENLLENLLQRLEVTEEEIKNVAEELEKEILKLLEMQGVVRKIEVKKPMEISEIKDVEKKLNLVKKELAKRKS